MKRVVALALGIAVVGGAAFAQTNQVLSRNAVGYVRVDIPPAGKFNLVSVSFKGIGETNNTLQAILGDQLIAAATPALAERVHVYDRDVLQYIQYSRKAADGLFYFSTNFFVGSPVNPVIPNGTAFWLQSYGSATTTHQVFVMGEVPETLTNGFNVLGANITGGFLQQIGNPFPVDVDLNTFINTNDGARGSAASPVLADRIFMWDQSISNYIQYSLRSDSNKWFFSTNFFSAPAPVALLRPGVGAWYSGRTNFTWNEPKPYTYP